MILCKKFVVICSVCWRARYEDPGVDGNRGGWRELNALITEDHLEGDDFVLSYGYCATCGEAFVQEVHARQLTAAGQPYGSLQRHAVS
jgi:hypothetical protein